MALHVKKIAGADQHTIVFLHGLFGQGKNLGTVAKLLSPVATSYLVDLPNHGRSQWTEHFDYEEMVDLLAQELQELGAPEREIVLVGHSMGGRVAMLLALRYPRLVSKLVVIDMSPGPAVGTDEFQYYADVMCDLDLTTLKSRSDADSTLEPQIPYTPTRAFLLQNLHRDPTTETGWRWLPNIELLRTELDAFAQWPDAVDGLIWDGPVLWIAGGRSSYVTPAKEPLMHSYFPNTTLVRFEGVGHWVHAEAPEQTADAIRDFITAEG